MSPSHVAVLSALASAVTALQKSKSKDAKAILVDLEENHDDAMAILSVLPLSVPEHSDLSFVHWMTCIAVMGLNGDDIKNGAEPCIIEGRYAVRTKDGLKLGPKVS